MTVVFYISGHGFGHASREVEIIHAFMRLRPDVRLILRTAVSPSLLERSLEVNYELRPGVCDAAIVQPSSITQDDEATVREAVAFYETFDQRVESEVQALRSENVSLIVADIPPIAFEVASRLRVQSVAIGNFTWDWIFEEHPGMSEAAPWLVPRLRWAYEQAALALELPFSGGFEVFPVVRPLPLVARRPTRHRADTRAHFGVPEDKTLALLSFGGYGLPDLDLWTVDILQGGNWTVMTTDRSSTTGPMPSGVIFVPEAQFIGTGFRYEDLVAAADVVVTKPGYGIISECIAAGRPMLYTSRGNFREYEVLVEAMPKYLRCRYIDQGALMAGRWAKHLRELFARPLPPMTLETNGADAAALELASLLDASRSG